MTPVIRNVLFVGSLLVVCALADAAWACPGCKAALASSDGSQGNLVSGMFWSIMFMMSMPFTILGVFSGSIYLAIRRARKQQDQQADHRDRAPLNV